MNDRRRLASRPFNDLGLFHQPRKSGRPITRRDEDVDAQKGNDMPPITIATPRGRPATTAATHDTSIDVDYAHRLDRRSRLIVAAEHISMPEAILQAGRELRGEVRIVDPGSKRLYAMALAWCNENRVNDVRKGVLAVSREYQSMVDGPATATEWNARESDELDASARRRMTEDRTLSYRDALIEEDMIRAGKTPARPSSRIRRPKTDTGDAKPSTEADLQLPTAAEIQVRADEKGITFEDAYQQLFDEARSKQTATAATESDALDAAARRYMAEHPGVKYRDALLAASGPTPMSPTKPLATATTDSTSTIVQVPKDEPHKGDVDRTTQPQRPTVEQVTAYAKKRGLTYREAELELARILNDMNPEGGDD